MQKEKKHPKLDDNFDIQRQLEHFKYEVIQALNTKRFLILENILTIKLSQ